MLLETIEICWLGDESDTIIWIDRSGPFTALCRVDGLMVGVKPVRETRGDNALKSQIPVNDRVGSAKMYSSQCHQTTNTAFTWGVGCEINTRASFEIRSILAQSVSLGLQRR